MMTWILPVSVFLLGLLGGAVLAWLTRVSEIRTIWAELQRVETQRGGLATDLQAQLSQCAGLNARLDERTSRIEELERNVAAAGQLQERLNSLSEQQGRLQAELEGEKRAGGVSTVTQNSPGAVIENSPPM